MTGLSAPLTRCSHDLSAVVDDLHALFADWGEEGLFADVLGAFGLYVVQLAVHEWVANLVQHAAFGRRSPEIRFTFTPEANGLRCVIEDNSDGFDFQRQLGRQEALVAEPEPGERGRGLLMMIACADDLVYESAGGGRQRLAFVVRRTDAPAGFLPLFPSLSAHGRPLASFGSVGAGGVAHAVESVP